MFSWERIEAFRSRLIMILLSTPASRWLATPSRSRLRKSPNAATVDVPSIDISKTSLISLDEIVEACQDTGFLTLTGHGIDLNLVRSLMDQGKIFFDLDQDVKERFIVNHMTMGRGYEISPEHIDYMENTFRKSSSSSSNKFHHHHQTHRQEL